MSVKMFSRDENGRVEAKIIPPEESNTHVATGWVFCVDDFPEIVDVSVGEEVKANVNPEDLGAIDDPANDQNDNPATDEVGEPEQDLDTTSPLLKAENVAELSYKELADACEFLSISTPRSKEDRKKAVIKALEA